MKRQKEEWRAATTRPPMPSPGVDADPDLESPTGEPASTSTGRGQMSPTGAALGRSTQPHTAPAGESAADGSTRVEIVDFRNGEAVVRHPDLRDILGDGWQIKSAVPHVSETEEVRLLVVMTRSLSMPAQESSGVSDEA